jgi:hypothetical protein
MRQRAPEPIEPPHDQGISFPHIGQGRRQAGPLGLRARNGALAAERQDRCNLA